MSKENIYNRLMDAIGNIYGVCGLMGSIGPESNFSSTNMQNSSETRLGMNDTAYTQAVDNGSYTNFTTDRVGYGLCQWTSSGRKAGLLAFAKEQGKSIGDENMQIDYLIHELSTGYKKVFEVLKNATSVKEASDVVVLQYERPASVGKNASEETKQKTLEKRMAQGMAIFAEFAQETEGKDECTVKKKICIDAGHYGKYNRSPANKKYYESEAMWKLHLLQKKYLEAYGFEVILTRKKQGKDLALQSRGKKAKGCELFISNHSNAVGSGINEAVDHVAVYHLTADTTTKCDDVSKEIAEKLAPVIANVMQTQKGYKVLTRKSGNDRNGDGIMNDNYYGVLHGARIVNVPALIIEHGFHTNTKNTNWLLNDDNLDKMAKAEAEVIAEYFGMTKSSGSSSNTSSNNGQVATGGATSEEYTLTQFIKDVQRATGAKVDGIAGSETLSKTVTVSATKNRKHAVVKAIQKRLNALGYNCGTADGIAGKKFTSAVNSYQKSVLKYASTDGEITAKGKMWKSLLGML